ncbi:hypothetical protein AB0B89_35335, partial [Sphaerisporangium sp. NPDC049002]
MVNPSPAGPSRVVLHRWTAMAPSESGVTAYLDPFGGETTTWPYTRWTSEERDIGFPATELVPSWTAGAPKGSWIRVELRARTAAGGLTKWYDMGRWAEGEDDIHRTSLPGQGDEDGDVAVDTFVATRPVTAYRLRVTLHGAEAAVRTVGVMSCFTPEQKWEIYGDALRERLAGVDSYGLL